MLVALAVFGVLSVVAYMALGQTLSNADLLGERMARLEAIQRTVRYLDSDLMQAAPRPVRVASFADAERRLLRRLAPRPPAPPPPAGWKTRAPFPPNGARTFQSAAHHLRLSPSHSNHRFQSGTHPPPSKHHSPP